MKHLKEFLFDFIIFFILWIMLMIIWKGAGFEIMVIFGIVLILYNQWDNKRDNEDKPNKIIKPQINVYLNNKKVKKNGND